MTPLRLIGRGYNIGVAVPCQNPTTWLTPAGNDRVAPFARRYRRDIPCPCLSEASRTHTGYRLFIPWRIDARATNEFLCGPNKLVKIENALQVPLPRHDPTH